MSKRIAFIDNLRIAVSFLIVVNHAIWNKTLAGHFSEDGMVLVEIMRSFSMHIAPVRVPVFFVIAGIFTTVYLVNKGARSFITTRARRVVLPLFVALFSYAYIVVALSRHNDVTALWNFGLYTEYLSHAFYGFGYVWFLYVLILYSLITLIVYFIAGAMPALRRMLDALSILVCRNRYLFFAALLVMAAGQFVLWHFPGDPIPGRLPNLPNLPNLPLHSLIRNAGFFVIGALAGLNFPRFRQAIRFKWWEAAALILAYAAMGVAGHIMGNKPSFLLYSLVSNALPLVLFIGLFNGFLNIRRIAFPSWAIPPIPFTSSTFR